VGWVDLACGGKRKEKQRKKGGGPKRRIATAWGLKIKMPRVSNTNIAFEGDLQGKSTLEMFAPDS